MNLGNDVPQSIIANHVFQRLIRRLTYFLSFWFICCVDCYFPIGTISDDIKPVSYTHLTLPTTSRV